MDLLYLALAVAFFGLSVIFVMGCEQLRRPS